MKAIMITLMMFVGLNTSFASDLGPTDDTSPGAHPCDLDRSVQEKEVSLDKATAEPTSSTATTDSIEDPN